MEASSSSSNIPNDIIRLILSQLPVKSVIRCQSVCKQWRSLIDDSDFKFSYRGQRRVIFLSTESISKDRDRRWRPISRFLVRSTSHDLRLRRHKFPFGHVGASMGNGLRVLCSCNGFVLLQVATKDIWLWNPSTKCSTKVLELPDLEKLDNPSIFASGLCYDSCTRDYKVVLLLRHHLVRVGQDFGDLFVTSASLNHKEWRPVQFPCNLDSFIRSDGVEFHNTFYWLASDMKDWHPYRNNSWLGRDRIIYFDPVRDKFRILPLPTSGLRENFSIYGLGVIDDCICMAACMVQEEKEEPKPKTVWIMKEYGSQESWMIAFALQVPEFGDIYWRVGFTFYSQNKNAQKVLFMHRVGGCERTVYVYDRKKGELKADPMAFLARPDRKTYTSMCFYVESLACPHQPQWIDLER